MNITRRQKLLTGFIVLILVMLACGPTPTSTPKQPTDTPEANISPIPQANSTANGDNLTQAQKSQLAHATVRIWGVQDFRRAGHPDLSWLGHNHLPYRPDPDQLPCGRPAGDGFFPGPLTRMPW